MKKSIGIIGATGHFGRVIAKEMISTMPDISFVLYGRRNPEFIFSNAHFEPFDFNKDETIPGKTGDLALVIDLSGPVKDTDGKSLLACVKKNIPYMDMALHNSHLDKLKSVYKRFPQSTILAHFGFFPGLSNLIIAKGFEIQKQKSGILANEFPVYAGGGKNVSLSLKDMLNESKMQKNIRDGKLDFFLMHDKRKKFPWNNKTKYFYQWEYPEIESYLYSNPDVIDLERYFSIKPSIINKSFKIAVKLWNSPLNKILEKIIPAIIYFLKSTLFKKNDPSMKMKFFNIDGSKCLIELHTHSAVKFHGFIMASFVRSFIKKNIHAGLFTPEQLFTLDEILKEGDHENYKLAFHQG